MAEVHKFYPKDAANNPDMVLEQAAGVYDSVLIMGYTPDGTMDVRMSQNMNNARDLMWLLESFKLCMMDAALAPDEE